MLVVIRRGQAVVTLRQSPSLESPTYPLNLPMAPQELRQLLRKGDWDAASSYVSRLPHDRPLDGSVLSLACRQTAQPPSALLRNLFRHIAPAHRLKGFNDALSDLSKRYAQEGLPPFFTRSAESHQRQITDCHKYFTAALEAWEEGRSDGVRITFKEYGGWGLTQREALMMWVRPRPPQVPSPKRVVVMAMVYYELGALRRRRKWPDNSLLSLLALTLLYMSSSCSLLAAPSKRDAEPEPEAVEFLDRQWKDSKAVLEIEGFMRRLSESALGGIHPCIGVRYFVNLFRVKREEIAKEVRCGEERDEMR